MDPKQTNLIDPKFKLYINPMPSEQVRVIREQIMCITQAHFADLLGVTPKTISTWEHSLAPKGPYAKLLWMIAVSDDLHTLEPQPSPKVMLEQMLQHDLLPK